MYQSWKEQMTRRKNPATRPPGWYPDPGGQPLLRWWDGSRWDEHTQSALPPAALPDPAAQAPPGHEVEQPPPHPVVLRVYLNCKWTWN